MQRLLRSRADYRKTILRNLLTSLVLYESIITKSSYAKRLESYANHFFNKASKADLVAKKLAHQVMFDKNAIVKTFEDILPRYGKDEKTFVKVLGYSARAGDSAPQSMVTFVNGPKIKEVVAKPEEKKSKTKAK